MRYVLSEWSPRDLQVSGEEVPFSRFPRKDQLHSIQWSWMVGLNGIHWCCTCYIDWKCQLNKALWLHFLLLCQFLYSLKFRAPILANLFAFNLFYDPISLEPEYNTCFFSSEHIYPLAERPINLKCIIIKVFTVSFLINWECGFFKLVLYTRLNSFRPNNH